MPKIIFSLFLSSAFLSASEQMVLVLAEELNATSGILQRYEKHAVWEKTGSKIPVNLGRNGLGYAFGKEPLKYEGDGRSPAGIFTISSTFGYGESPNSALPYQQADENLICVDDVNDSRYNRIVARSNADMPKSFEWMRREDDVYRNGAVIDYNTAAEKGRGSCIFIHLNHADRRPTSGCTAMDEAPLKEMLEWFDPLKHPVMVLIPKNDCKEYRERFSGIDCD